MHSHLSVSIISKLFFVLAFFVSTYLCSTGQQPNETNTQKQSDLRIETDLIQIDAVVKDRKGSHVLGLKREDFEVLEDGKPQQVTHFAIGTAERSASYLNTLVDRKFTKTPPTEAPDKDQTSRYIILAIDDAHLAAENLVAVKQALTRFINEQMASGDQVAIFTTSGTLNVFQHFTGDRGALRRAVERLKVEDRSLARSSEIPHISDYQAELIEQGDGDALQIAVEELLQRKGKNLAGARPNRGRGSAADGAIGPFEGQARARARVIVAENAQATVATLSMIQKVIQALRPLAGHKMMALLSDGFFMEGARNFTPFELSQITDAATRSGVVIYSIDTRGLVAKPPGGSSADAPTPIAMTRTPGRQERMAQKEIDARREGLFTLAADTGGIAIFNHNDLNLGLRRMLADNESYYVLAYEPANLMRERGFHKIEVRVIGHPELEVRTRKGYFAPAAKDSGLTVEKSKDGFPEKNSQEFKVANESRFRAALSSPFPLRGIPLDCSADFINTQDAGPVVIITTHITLASINFEQRNEFHHSTLELVGVLLDEQGKVVRNFDDRLELNLDPEQFTRAVNEGLSYRKIEALKPGFYNVRLAVGDGALTQMGSGSQWVEIPDTKRKKLTLSGIFLGREGESVYESLTTPTQISGGNVSQQPSPIQARRRFRRGTKFDFLLFIYNAITNMQDATNTTVQVQVLTGNQLVYSSPSRLIAKNTAQGQQEIPYAARLSLDSYKPGEYELHIKVGNQSAKIVATQSITFIVE